jgi:sec-independent protein translocase protein TatA
MPSLGFQEIIVILLIALLVFGPKKLPEIGRTLGSAMRELRKASRDFSSSLENLDVEDEPDTHTDKRSETS